jgi:multiple sugar transport system substrate-binding protein
MSPRPIRIAVRKYSDFESALSEQLALYRSLHPGVSFEAVPLDLHDLYGALFTTRGLFNGNWDLAFIVTDWLAEAVALGGLEDLSSLMQAEPLADWPAAWPRSLVDPLLFNDKLYSIPWHDGPECLIYRTDLFADPGNRESFASRVGYPLAPPATWQQFRDVAAFFTCGNEQRFGTLFAAFPDGHNTLYDFTLQLWSRGGDYLDAAGKPRLNSAEAVASLDFYRDIVRDPQRCHPESARLDSTASGDVFLREEIAMMVNWFGFAARCDRPDSPLRGRTAIAPIPSANGHNPASLSVFWTIGICAGSARKEEAYRLLGFLAGEHTDKLLAQHGAVPVRLSSWNDKAIQAAIPAYRDLEKLSLHARTLPRSSELPKLAAIVNEAVQLALTTEQSSAEILMHAQRRAVAENVRLTQ